MRLSDPPSGLSSGTQALWTRKGNAVCGLGPPIASAPACRSSCSRPHSRRRWAPLLAVWQHLTEQLALVDAALGETAAANPVVRRLATAPGVGPLIATAFVATLDEAGRFAGAHQDRKLLRPGAQ